MPAGWVATAFVAGLLTFLSPCILPMVPIYIANIAGSTSLDESPRRWSTLFHTLVFVIGFSVVFIALAALLYVVGTAIPRTALQIVSGVLLIGFGVFLIAATKVRWLNYGVHFGKLAGKGKGYLRSLLLGLTFALGWTPCVTPMFAGMGLVAANFPSVAWGVLLLVFYVIGLGLPFIIVGLALGQAKPVIRWLSRRGVIISIVGGILLIIVGLLTLTNNLGILQFGLT